MKSRIFSVLSPVVLWCIACVFTLVPVNIIGQTGLTKPVTEISGIISEVRIIDELELWPGFAAQEIPVMVYDSIDTWLIFSETIPEGFKQVPGKSGVYAYKGQHPLVRGNSIVRIDERWMATSVLSGHSKRTGERYSRKDLAGIIVHEQFHIFQRLNHQGWRQNDGVLLFYPTETNESILLRKLEKESFRRAVISVTENEIAGWALKALQYRNERLGLVPEVFSNYEKELQRTEGISEYIEKKARDLDPLNTTDITNGIAPAGIRDLGYVEGRWIAMILDKIKPGWKNLLEENDNLFPEDILRDQLSLNTANAKRFNEKEIESLRAASDSVFNQWQLKKTKEITEYMEQPGYILEIESSGNPFSIRIFEPLEIELTENRGVFHRVIFSGANQGSSVRIMNHPCITFFSDNYQLTKILITGLREKPVINNDNRRCALKYEGIDISLEYAELDETGSTIRIRL